MRLTFKLKVYEDSGVVDALSALCQFCENQKPLVSTAILVNANALQNHSEGIEVRLSNTAPANNSNSPEPLEPQKDERENNTCRENPLADIERDFWLNACELIKGQQIDRCKNIDDIYSD